MSYNGWKNYETWCVSLWLDNDEGLYSMVREMLPDYIDDGDGVTDTDRRANEYALGRALRSFVDDLAEETCPGSRSGASFVADLLGAALSEVDYDEIAANLLSEVDA